MNCFLTHTQHMPCPKEERWMGKADDNQAQEKTKNDYLLVNDDKMSTFFPGSMRLTVRTIEMII